MFGGAGPFRHFGRGHYEEHSCEIVLNLDQWFRRRCLLKKQFTGDGRKTDVRRRPITNIFINRCDIYLDSSSIEERWGSILVFCNILYYRKYGKELTCSSREIRLNFFKVRKLVI